MSVLVNCCSLEQLEKCLKGIKFLFNSPFWSKDVARTLTTLRDMVGLLGCPQSHADFHKAGGVDAEADSAEEEDVTVEDEDEHVDKTLKKPFGAYFDQRLRKGKEHEGNGGKVNKYHKPRLFEMLEKKWIPTIPIWTSLMRGILKINNYFHEKNIFICIFTGDPQRHWNNTAGVFAVKVKSNVYIQEHN